MKRKSTLVLLSCLAAVSMVAGCSGAPASSAPVSSAPAPQSSSGSSPIVPGDGSAIPEGGLVISGGPSGGNAYVVSACFADLLTRAGCQVDIIPGGGTANAVGTSNKTTDMGWCMESNLMEAIQGVEAFDKAYTNISNIIRLDPNPCIIIVPEDSDIKTVADLKGKTVATPQAGTSSQIFVQHILEASGFDPEKDLNIRQGSMNDGLELYKDRLVDAVITTTSFPNSGITDTTMTIKSRFIPLTDEIIGKLEAKNPGYQKFTYPDDGYTGMGKGYTTVESSGVILVNNDMSEDDVYWITKTINESWDDSVAASCAWLKTITPEMRGSSKTPMHPGAAKYYKEIGVLK